MSAGRPAKIVTGHGEFRRPRTSAAPRAAVRALRIAAFAALGVASAARAASPEATGRIGVQVLSLSPEVGVDPNSARLMTDFLVSELSKHPQLQVFGQSDLQGLLAAARQQKQLECNTDADSCLAEVAGAMGARWLIGGSIGVLGTKLLITLRLTDTRRHQMLAHVTEETGAGTTEMLSTIQDLVERLLEEARVIQPDVSVTAAPPRSHATGWWLLAGCATAAAVAGVTGGIAFSDWSQASGASESYLATGSINPGMGGGSYGQTRKVIEPVGITSEVALGVAAALGIAAWVAW